MSSIPTCIRVLLVDDHKAVLWGLNMLIATQESRMQVVGQASSCAEALRLTGELRPDVVLLDLDLGGDSAVDVLQAMIANLSTRVLIFSGSRDKVVLDDAVMRGARGILRKSADADVILKAIEKVHGGELWLDNETLARVFVEMMTPSPSRKVDPEAQALETLTAKERRIISAVKAGTGAPNKVLAQHLFISEHTLRNHLTSIYDKLNVSNRLELYVWATKHQYEL